jgi:hypothetical protein
MSTVGWHNLVYLLRRVLVNDLAGVFSSSAILQERLHFDRPTAAIGDVAMLVKGSRVPLIFRDRSTSWELIGHAYVPGLMKGEQ